LNELINCILIFNRNLDNLILKKYVPVNITQQQQLQLKEKNQKIKKKEE